MSFLGVIICTCKTTLRGNFHEKITVTYKMMVLILICTKMKMLRNQYSTTENVYTTCCFLLFIFLFLTIKHLTSSRAILCKISILQDIFLSQEFLQASLSAILWVWFLLFSMKMTGNESYFSFTEHKIWKRHRKRL